MAVVDLQRTFMTAPSFLTPVNLFTSVEFFSVKFEEAFVIDVLIFELPVLDPEDGLL